MVLQPSPLSPSFTHYLPCSFGYTALKLAIHNNNDDVAAYLRSIGAPE
jgi:ankyrin repeat protein